VILSDPVISCSVATRDYEPRERNCRGQALALIDLPRPPSPGSMSEMAIYRQPFSDGCNLLDSNSLSHWGPEALEGKPLC